MSDIKRSIILFNGGSAGDFLKTICLEQLTNAPIYQLNDSGRIVLQNQYFKKITKDMHFQNYGIEQLDYDCIDQVDNTHFYHQWYHNFSTVYYIDYPDHVQPTLTEIYKNKVSHFFNNDPDKFFQYHLETLPHPLHKYFTLDNITKAITTRAISNLKNWRETPNLIKINFIDFFDQEKFKNTVETICDQPINFNLFLNSYNTWLDKNKDLIAAID
jgi:hypothetical protein